MLNNLIKLSSLAPQFDANADSIRAIVGASDAYDGALSQIELAAVEARRLLFILLVNTHRSPFLFGIHHHRAGTASGGEDQLSQMYLAHLSKVLHATLAERGHAPSTRALLGLVLATTPKIVPHFFRGLQLASDPRPTYRSLAALTFVEAILREAPPPPPLASSSVPAEQALASIIPPCVTKALLGKVLQSPSALMASSGLKLIITILRRARAALSSTAAGPDERADGKSERTKGSISQSIVDHLPEMAILFSIPSRFDPFEESTTQSANAVVMLQLCEAVQCYAHLEPNVIEGVKFDWTRLVPNGDEEQGTNRMFSSAQPPLQLRILRTLLGLLNLSQVSFSPKLLPNVLSVVVSTRIPEVYAAARKLAVTLMEKELFTHVGASSADNSEASQCSQYESSLWVDGISADIIQELVSELEESKHQQVKQKIMISQAWSKASLGCAMPALCVSPFLSSLTCRLMGGGDSSLSAKMSLLLVQTAMKMLLFQADPRPFAAIIAFCSNENLPGDERMTNLHHLAKAVVSNDLDVNASVERLASDVLLPESHLAKIARIATGRKKNGVSCLDVSLYSDPAVMVRQCLGIMHHAGDGGRPLNTFLRKILIAMLEVRSSSVGQNSCFPFNFLELSHLTLGERSETTSLLSCSDSHKCSSPAH